MASNNPTLNSFMPLAKLGEGTFSSVYKVKRISDGGLYALKKIKIACLKEKQRANALNQIRILASLSSNYIITYKQAFFDEKLSLLCIVMEWANHGDLLKIINQHREKKKLFTEAEIWKAAYHILSGLLVLHNNSILHRDLKSANIFICDGTYKLGDLNVSKVNDHQQRLVKTQTGTPFYASPQIWRDQPYGSQSDIWSFGCILYEMCCLRPPFNGKDLNDLYKCVQRGSYEPLPKVYSRQLQQIISQCLHQKASDRPSAESLLKNNGIILTKCDFYEIPIEKQLLKSNDKLLSTIKMPQDLKKLNSQLPESKYECEDYEQGKTAKICNSKMVESDSVKVGRSIKTQNCKVIAQSQQNYPPKYSQHVPLPERIKNHLNSINRSENRILRKNYNQKVKIHSSITQPKQEIVKKSSECLSPIKECATETKKKRPLSCNYLHPRPNDKNSPYFISNLRPHSGAPLIYNSDRKPFAGALRDKSEMFSDRKLIGSNSRDPYLIQKLQRLERQKIRCRSTNIKSIKSSGYSELKQRLEARYRNLRELPVYESQQLGSKPYPHVRKDINNQINYSYAIPNSLSAHIYPQNINKNNSQKYSRGHDSYVYDLQSKILSGNSQKQRYDNLFGLKSSNESNIRRLVKGQNLFGKINKM